MAKVKEIANGIEKLDMEQLKEISGGSYAELREDSMVFQKLGKCSCYNISILKGSPEARSEVLSAWKNAGVEVDFRDPHLNIYYIDGVRVSRLEAIEYIKKKYGEKLE